MCKLKEILFQACSLEWNKFWNINDTDQLKNLVELGKTEAAFSALYSVIEQAGLEDEYIRWRTPGMEEGITVSSPKHKTPTRPLWASAAIMLALVTAWLLYRTGYVLARLAMRCDKGIKYLERKRDELKEVRT